MINLNLSNLLLETEENIKAVYSEKITEIKKNILDKSGLGSDYLGWTDWPTQDFLNLELIKIKNIYGEWTSMNLDTVVVIGIGGSCLGSRAGIEMCGQPFHHKPKILYVSGLHSVYNQSLLENLKNKNWAIIVISKSGETFETSVNFRLYREALHAQYQEDCRDRIVAITDKEKGVLKTLCDRNGYHTLTIPADISGQYSTLTSVGLLPMIFAGVDIDEILNGWKSMLDEFRHNEAVDTSAMLYAATRNILNVKHEKRIEIFCTYENNMRYIAEQYKQMFAVLEGKKTECILPLIANNSEDLHSVGHLYREGIVNAFETSLTFGRIDNSPIITASSFSDDDQLNYLAGKKLTDLNKSIHAAVTVAHTKDAQIPNIEIEIDKLSCFNFGYLSAWLAIAAATSAYLINVNPFDRTSVDDYKSVMNKLVK